MKKPQYPLNRKELKQSGVTKVILSYNGDLKSEVEDLKKSLKISQDAHEDLREKNHVLKSDNLRLKDRLQISFIPEGVKLFSSIGIGYFTNIVSSDHNNLFSWIFLAALAFLVIIVIIFQNFRNK